MSFSSFVVTIDAWSTIAFALLDVDEIKFVVSVVVVSVVVVAGTLLVVVVNFVVDSSCAIVARTSSNVVPRTRANKHIAVRSAKAQIASFDRGNQSMICHKVTLCEELCDNQSATWFRKETDKLKQIEEIACATSICILRKTIRK